MSYDPFEKVFIHGAYYEKRELVAALEIVKRLDTTLKNFEATDWNELSRIQPIEFSYASRFHSMLKDIKRGKNES
jgi:hypothetical protein